MKNSNIKISVTGDPTDNETIIKALDPDNAPEQLTNGNCLINYENLGTAIACLRFAFMELKDKDEDARLVNEYKFEYADSRAEIVISTETVFGQLSP